MRKNERISRMMALIHLGRYHAWLIPSFASLTSLSDASIQISATRFLPIPDQFPICSFLAEEHFATEMCVSCSAAYHMLSYKIDTKHYTSQIDFQDSRMRYKKIIKRINSHLHQSLQRNADIWFWTEIIRLVFYSISSLITLNGFFIFKLRRFKSNYERFTAIKIILHSA